MEKLIYNCENCGQELRTSIDHIGYVITCPTCKNDMVVPKHDKRSKEQIKKKQSKKMSNRDKILLTIGSIIMFSSMIFIESAEDKRREIAEREYNTTGWKERNHFGRAFVLSEELVKASLKCPSTAEFPSAWCASEYVQRNDQTYTVSAWVDAQNSFGAMVRSNYKIRLVKTGAGYNDWYCTYFEFDGQVLVDK